jgi:hypothetical protein
LYRKVSFVSGEAEKQIGSLKLDQHVVGRWLAELLMPIRRLQISLISQIVAALHAMLTSGREVHQ